MGAAVAYLPELSAADLDEPRAVARSDLVITTLRLVYDYDWAQGKATKAMLLEAPDAISLYGRTEAEHAAGWLHLPRLAFALGEPLLKRWARPRWELSFGVPWRIGLTIAPGQDISISHPRLPVAGAVLVADAQLDWSSATVNLTCWAPAGPAPRVVLAQSAEQFAPVQPSGVAVVYRDGVATLTILDDAGQPLANAKATLDGAQTRLTDAGGRVQFSTARGKHTLLIQAAGYAALQAEITI